MVLENGKRRLHLQYTQTHTQTHEDSGKHMSGYNVRFLIMGTGFESHPDQFVRILDAIGLEEAISASGTIGMKKQIMETISKPYQRLFASRRYLYSLVVVTDGLSPFSKEP